MITAAWSVVFGLAPTVLLAMGRSQPRARPWLVDVWGLVWLAGSRLAPTAGAFLLQVVLLGAAAGSELGRERQDDDFELDLVDIGVAGKWALMVAFLPDPWSLSLLQFVVVRYLLRANLYRVAGSRSVVLGCVAVGCALHAALHDDPWKLAWLALCAAAVSRSAPRVDPGVVELSWGRLMAHLASYFAALAAMTALASS